MFSRILCFALFSLYLSAFTALAAPAAGSGIQRRSHFAYRQEEPQGAEKADASASAGSEPSSTATAVGEAAAPSDTSDATGSAATPADDVNTSPKGDLKSGESDATPAASESTGTASAAPADGTSTTASNAALADASATVSSAAAAETSVAANNTGDPQKSLTLDPTVIATGFADDGQSVPAAGQVASLTSTNNFINFCATVPDLPITNGKQIATGSCNPAPMGIIAATTNMPSSKFVFPPNFGTVAANTAFTIQMAISGMETGFFVNAQANYFAAPQFTNAQGDVQGHSHVVVQLLTSLEQTEPADPKVFAFFKGLNGKANNGILTASVDKGLPAGVYKLSSINTAANHQPILVGVAQHGSLDDAVYFTVTDDGAPPPANTATVTPPGGTATDVATGTGTATATGTSTETGKAAETGGAAGTGDATGNANETGKPAETGNATETQKANDTGKATRTRNAAGTGEAAATGKGAGGGKATGSAGNDATTTPATATGRPNRGGGDKPPKGGEQNGGTPPATGSASASAAGATATGSNGHAIFGNCSIPKIEFGVGQDGKQLFNFGISASEEFSVIADFVCNILENNCEANDVAKQLCAQAANDAKSVEDKTGKPADVFNGWFGHKTNFHRSPKSF